MKTLHFEIPYHTRWGERVELIYSIDDEPPSLLPLKTKDGDVWQGNLETADDAHGIRHAYQIVNEEKGMTIIEDNCWRDFDFSHRSEIAFADAWNETPLSDLYQRSAFLKCFMKPEGAAMLSFEQLTFPCLLLLHALPPGKDLVWAVVGEGERWGNWDPQRARILDRTKTYEWALALHRDDFIQGACYKYVLLDRLNPQHVIWEEGGNRIISPTLYTKHSSFIRQDEHVRIKTKAWKGAGVVIPIFSLRSEGSMGIGDFGDLCALIKWAAGVGMNTIQILPVNDTTRDGTWRDSYPYNAISVYALHPIYLDLREWSQTKAYADCIEEGQRLNSLSSIDYEATYKLKTRFLRNLYEEKGRAVKKNDTYQCFIRNNREWLIPYAEFCCYRDHFGHADFRLWPHTGNGIDYQIPEDDINYWLFVQYLLHRQMTAAHSEAIELGVVIKGDIPIGISPDSVPAWKDGHLFHFDGQAGAPPDAFATKGQNWGFPTYNWEEMAKDDYAWWRKRLSHMSKYFDAYRIDHVLGFFRIWEVPSDQIEGILGHFRPALPYSLDEIRHFGFKGDIESCTHPYLSQEKHNDLCGQFGSDTMCQYIEKEGNHYTLRTAYRSQRTIRTQVTETQLRRLLMEVSSDLLFVRDPDTPNYYHPRIAAQDTAAYASLSDENKVAFNKLHDAFFYHRHNEMWSSSALAKLAKITGGRDHTEPTLQLYAPQGTGMLPCAEDLGMIPSGVKETLEKLNILSLEIQRMPKEYGVRFGHLERNPYYSVATISTHDMPPFRLWWQQDKERRDAYWHEFFGRTDDAPATADPSLCETVVRQHLQCPSMLCILAMQDWLAISPTLRNPHPEQEQINDPANPNQYWNYRLHITLEELICATDFNEKVRGLIQMTRQS